MGNTGTPNAAQRAVTSVERGFDSLTARIEAIGRSFGDAIAHPFCPAPLREALPALVDVLHDVRQELAELRRPCPCEGASAPAPAPATTAGPASSTLEA